MGLGVSPRVLLVAALAVAAGCGAGDDPKPVRLNPQPDVPVVPDANRNTGVGHTAGTGGSASSRDTLRRAAPSEGAKSPRSVGAGTQLSDPLGEGGGGAGPKE